MTPDGSGSGTVLWAEWAPSLVQESQVNEERGVRSLTPGHWVICGDCEVGWVSEEGLACWVCREPGYEMFGRKAGYAGNAPRQSDYRHLRDVWQGRQEEEYAA